MKGLVCLLLFAFVLISCESEDPVSTVDTSTFMISFDSRPTTTYGIVGDTVSIPIAARITERRNGEVVTSGVARQNVAFTLQGPVGDFSPAVVACDSMGKASTVLIVVLTEDVTSIPIRAEIPGDVADLSVRIDAITRPDRLILSAPATRLLVPGGEEATLDIRGVLVNADGYAIEDWNVSARIERDDGEPFGYIAEVNQYSEEDDGSFLVKFNSDGQFGAERVVVSVQHYALPASRREASLDIEVAPLEDEVATFSLHALPSNVILPESGEQAILIMALALDAEGLPVEGVGVDFTSTIGTIERNGVTDSTGIASALWHTGDEAASAILNATIPGTAFSVTDTVALSFTDVEEPPVFTSLSIFADDLELIARSNASTTIRAVALVEGNRFAPEGTVVGFMQEAGNGRFEVDRAPVNERGEASVRLTVGDRIEEIRVKAFVEIPEEGFDLYSDAVEIQAVAGAVSRIEMRANPQEINDDLGESAVITGRLTDDFGNPISTQTLLFSTSIGSITPTAITDANGEARATLASFGTTGIAHVAAWMPGIRGEIDVAVTSSALGSLVVSANPLEIYVREVAGQLGSAITVRTFDYNGNLLTAPKTLIFQLLNQPEGPDGCTFPNNTQIDSVVTEDGVGLTTLRPGFLSGGVILKVFSWKDSLRTDTVLVVYEKIRVVSGPPAALDIDFDPRGTDAGGGYWNVTATARIYDAHRNPVPDSIPVMFTVQPDDIATITNGFTENGLARATITYASLKTFEPITIHAAMQVRDGQISNNRPAVLPLQRGFLTLTADPANWMFDRGRPEDTCVIRVWATLRDGHDITINKAPIIFTTDRARYYWRDQVGGRFRYFDQNLVRKYTGVRNQNHNEEPGVATVYLRGRMADFYLDDFTLEVAVHLEATVEGTDVFADPVTVSMSRH